MSRSRPWHEMLRRRARLLVESQRRDLVDFARALVRIPSLPGEESAIAARVLAEMQSLGYDHAWIDEVGNVIGQVRGGEGPRLILNGHLDHVDAGDPAAWPCPPFSGELRDGALWGRGAADMKGALAAMVYAGALVSRLGQPLPGPLAVAATVQEEVGGLGARHLAASLPMERAVIGEASANQLRRGHRGRIELVAHLEGRSVHASMPDLGVNPHHSLAPFLEGLRRLPMAAHPDYGHSTVAPTRISSEPTSANVTPSALRLLLDWRNVPGEATKHVVAQLEALLSRCLAPGCRGRIEVATKELTSYTGATLCYPDEFPSFTTAVDDPFLTHAREALEDMLGRNVEVGTWRFATDGGHFAAAGAKVIGFGPGDDALVHTVQERLPLDQLVESVSGYLALIFVGADS